MDEKKCCICNELMSIEVTKKRIEEKRQAFWPGLTIDGKDVHFECAIQEGWAEVTWCLPEE